MYLNFIYRPTGPSAASNLLAVSIVLPILAIVTVVFRFKARRHQKTAPGVDDWLTLLALVFVVGMGVCGILGERKRVWGHLDAAETNNSDRAFNEGKLLEAFQYIQIVAVASIKCSALTFYTRIFCVKGLRSAFDYVIKITLAIVAIWAVAMIISNSLQCGSRISALWGGTDQWLLYCEGSTTFENAFAISNFLLDFWILLIPLPKIFHLHTTVGRKLAISAVFSLALVGVAASIARMAAYIQIQAFADDLSTSYLLEDTVQVYWSNFEAGLCLVAVNLPSLWYYATKVSPTSVLQSMRSMVSLRSMRSSGSITRTDTAGQAAFAGAGCESLHSQSSSHAPTTSTHDISLTNWEKEDLKVGLPPRHTIRQDIEEGTAK